MDPPRLNFLAEARSPLDGDVPLGAAVQRLHLGDEEGLPVEAAKTTTPVTLSGAALPSG